MAQLDVACLSLLAFLIFFFIKRKAVREDCSNRALTVCNFFRQVYLSIGYEQPWGWQYSIFTFKESLSLHSNGNKTLLLESNSSSNLGKLEKTCRDKPVGYYRGGIFPKFSEGP